MRDEGPKAPSLFRGRKLHALKPPKIVIFSSEEEATAALQFADHNLRVFCIERHTAYLSCLLFYIVVVCSGVGPLTLNAILDGAF